MRNQGGRGEPASAARWPAAFRVLLVPAGDYHDHGTRFDQLCDATECGTRSRVGPVPILDQHNDRLASAQHADKHRQRVEQCRLQVFTRASASAARRHRWPSTGDAERAARYGSSAGSSAPNSAGDDIGADQRRPQIERGAKELYRHPVRDTIGIRATARAQHAHIVLAVEARLQFVHQTAFSCARFTDDRDDRSDAASSTCHVRLNGGQL